jgi:YidC/Oxa1 family membrane protein insertase
VADRMFHLGIPFVEHFNLLPLLMVALWWLLQRGTPLPKDPQQRQMAVMMRFMPLMFGVLLYNYAAGLMVYMITSSLWGIVEQRITKKILGPISPDAVQAGTVPMM